MEVLVEHLDEVVDGLEISQVIIADVHADTEVQPRIPPVHDLKVPKLKRQNTKNVSVENLYIQTHAIGSLGFVSLS